jgi:HK97 family phage major capsid protein
MSLVKQLAQAEGRQIEIGDDIEAIGSVAEAEARDLTDDDQTRIADLTAESDKLVGTIKNLRAAVEAKDRIAKARITPQLIQQQDADQRVPTTQNALPARVKQTRSKHYASTYDAYCVGQWLAAKFCHRPEAQAFCREHGVGDFRGAMEGGTDTLGGFSVPDPMAATIIELMEEWGVFRANARNVVMTSDTLDVPKLDASMTVFYPAEGGAITASDLTFGSVGLVAVKYAALGLMSTELNEDSVISMVDLLTRDIARMFAYSEDLNGFLGTGVTDTPTGAGPITGIGDSLQAGAKVTLGTAGWANATLQDFEAMAGKLKQYGGISPRWYISRYGYFNTILDLLNTAGGTDMRQIEEGGELMFLGYPVTFTQVLPGETIGLSDLLAVLGDLDLGSYLGTRRQVSIRTLNELYAANDQIGVLGTLRSDIQIHSVGDATDAGAIVGLYNAAA